MLKYHGYKDLEKSANRLGISAKELSTKLKLINSTIEKMVGSKNVSVDWGLEPLLIMLYVRFKDADGKEVQLLYYGEELVD